MTTSCTIAAILLALLFIAAAVAAGVILMLRQAERDNQELIDEIRRLEGELRQARS